MRTGPSRLCAFAASRPRRLARCAALATTVVVAAALAAPTAGAAPQARSSVPSVGPYALTRYADNGVIAYGTAPFAGAPTGGVTSPIVAMAASADGGGYWLAGANGKVYAYGDAPFRGPYAAQHFAAPVVGMAATATGRGYWLVTAAGGVYAYGDAVNYGATVSHHVTSPVVSITATPDGLGYWVLTASGGGEAFGDARWFGGLHGTKLTGAVGLGSTGDGLGYWIATAAGAVASFGDAPASRRPEVGKLTSSVAGIAVASGGLGYWLVAANGTVQSWGGPWHGDNSKVLPVQPDAGIVTAPGRSGYWLLEPDAFPTTFANPGGGSALGRRIVAEAASRVAGDPDTGLFCNAYGPCEAWCALFASWAWEAGGVAMSRYAFTGYVYDWAAGHTAVLSGAARPQPGDAVFYGTGPWSTATSVHMGIVAQVWPDGFIDTVEGDAGPAVEGHYGVVINGPFLPSQSLAYNGVAIYGYAVP